MPNVLDWINLFRFEVFRLKMAAIPTITHNIKDGVVSIQYFSNIGTGFFIKYNGVAVLVTAKHLVNGMEAGNNLNLLEIDGYVSHRVDKVIHHPDQDVTVILLNGVASSRSDRACIPTLFGDQITGHMVAFLGFPRIAGFIPFDGRNRPHTKSAMVSGWLRHEKGYRVICLDGHNNVGFSGGPVLSQMGTSVNSSENSSRAIVDGAALCGVISAYAYDTGSVTEVFEKRSGEDVRTNYFIKPNSGLILVTPVEAVVELMDTITSAEPPQS